MTALGLIILLASLGVSAAIYFLTGGHVLLVALPLMIGLPLAGAFGRRRR